MGYLQSFYTNRDDEVDEMSDANANDGIIIEN